MKIEHVVGEYTNFDKKIRDAITKIESNNDVPGNGYIINGTVVDIPKWTIFQDRNEEDPSLNSYSITIDPHFEGWRTDSGYDGYGLPKELAQWICDILNKHGNDCPYEMSYGYWKNK
jgi:hypothetical protein